MPTTTLLDEIIEQAAALTPEQRRELIHRLKQAEREQSVFEQTTNPTVMSPEERLTNQTKTAPLTKGYVSPNTLWLKAHRAEYAGKHVALKDGELIAFGDTIKEADLRAKAKGVEIPLLHYIPAPDEEVWGGW